MVFLSSYILTKGHLVWYHKSDPSSLKCEYLEEHKGQRHIGSRVVETVLSFSVHLYVIYFNYVPHFFHSKGCWLVLILLRIIFSTCCLMPSVSHNRKELAVLSHQLNSSDSPPNTYMALLYQANIMGTKSFN